MILQKVLPRSCLAVLTGRLGVTLVLCRPFRGIRPAGCGRPCSAGPRDRVPSWWPEVTPSRSRSLMSASSPLWMGSVSDQPEQVWRSESGMMGEVLLRVCPKISCAAIGDGVILKWCSNLTLAVKIPLRLWQTGGFGWCRCGLWSGVHSGQDFSGELRNRNGKIVIGDKDGSPDFFCPSMRLPPRVLLTRLTSPVPLDSGPEPEPRICGCASSSQPAGPPKVSYQVISKQQG